VELFLEPLKIRDIPGIGKKTEEKFAEMKLEKIGDLKRQAKVEQSSPKKDERKWK